MVAFWLSNIVLGGDVDKFVWECHGNLKTLGNMIAIDTTEKVKRINLKSTRNLFGSYRWVYAWLLLDVVCSIFLNYPLHEVYFGIKLPWVSNPCMVLVWDKITSWRIQICGWEEWLKYNTSPTFIGKRFQIFEVFLLLTSSSVCFVF